MYDTTMARLDPAWEPWSVPRVSKRPNSARAAAGASLIERWTAWRRPTAFQRYLAIHILNTTESVSDAAPATDAA
ncbi:MAG TPA: hypothetical protein VGR79_01340 [Stellaceae bacterium]|nr:hypothetical protein [Stellaceae bacterium]